MVGEADIYGAGMPHPEINKWSCLPPAHRMQTGGQLLVQQLTLTEITTALRCNEENSQLNGKGVMYSIPAQYQCQQWLSQWNTVSVLQCVKQLSTSDEAVNWPPQMTQTQWD